MERIHLARFILLLIIATLSLNVVIAEDDRDVYTIKERVALKKFRLASMSFLKKQPDFMQTDQYLIGWLRAQHLDIDRAGDMLLKNLEWRKLHNLDNILNVKFPHFEKGYPVLYVTDRKFRPVLILPVGAWDVRKVIVAGHRDDFEKFIKQLFERSFAKVRENFETKGNVTQMSTILDLAGYNTRQHACPLCIPIYINMIMNYERYYPQGIHRLIGINTPPIFNALLEILKPFMSEHSRNSLEFYGFDKEKWKKIILEEIAPDELPLQYGGTKQIVIH